jgi:hypothetical protein
MVMVRRMSDEKNYTVKSTPSADAAITGADYLSSATDDSRRGDRFDRPMAALVP